MKRNKNKLIGTKQLLPKEKKRLLMLLLTILAIIGNLYAQNPQIWPTQISFNYEEGSSNDAIKIRKNASSSISVPEYVKDIRNENCAYIMGQSNRKIKVKFNSNNSNYNYMVKATVIDNGTGSSIGIGNVCEVFVAPCDFNTTEFTIALSGVVPEGIDKRTFTWKWEATALPINAPYCPIACTSVNTTHTFYTLLDEPHAPITEPWTDVLDLCNWAYGALTEYDAASMITQFLYDGSNFHYITAPRYGLDGTSFNLTDFLEDFGKGHYVNCLDMGKAVTTFANSIGCKMFLARFKASQYEFPINCIDPIGSPGFTNFPLSGGIANDCRPGGFAYHAFSQDRDGNVWDATLKYDIDSIPDNVSNSTVDYCGDVVETGHTWELPIGEPESIYLDKLIDNWVNPKVWGPSSWVNCSNAYDCGELFKIEFIIQ